MIANATSTVFQLSAPSLQNPLTADVQTTESPASMIPQAAMDSFALRINAAMIEMLVAQGVCNASPLSKKLRAYAAGDVTPVQRTARFV